VSNSETGDGRGEEGGGYPAIPPGWVGKTNSLSHREDSPALRVDHSILVAHAQLAATELGARCNGDGPPGSGRKKPMGEGRHAPQDSQRCDS